MASLRCLSRARPSLPLSVKQNLKGGCLPVTRSWSSPTACRQYQWSASQYEDLSTHFDDKKGILTLILNRPERLNAMSKRMAEEVIDACHKICEGKNDIRAVAVTGSGKGFRFVLEEMNSGHDLRDTLSNLTSASDRSSYFRAAFDAVLAISHLPIPSVAVINGVCLGWGLEVALACDIRIASEKATLGLTQTTVGTFPASGGSILLPKTISPGLAKELIFTGAKLSGQRAASIGLVNHSVPHNELQTNADILLDKIAAASPLGCRAAKEVLNANRDGKSISEMVDMSISLRMPLNESKDFEEGCRAFVEKRKPKFSGE